MQGPQALAKHGGADFVKYFQESILFDGIPNLFRSGVIVNSDRKVSPFPTLVLPG